MTDCSSETVASVVGSIAGAKQYRAYSAYKDSSIEWLGKIPTHWEVMRTKQLLLRNDEGVIVLRSTEQTVDGVWEIRNPAKRRLTNFEHAEYGLKEGDLVVTKSSGSSLHIGKTSIVTQDIADLDCCYSNFMQRLRTNKNIAPRLLWYVLNGDVGRKQFDYLSGTTTGLSNINGEIIGMVSIAFPPAAFEQDVIIAFLDRQTAKLDALVAKKERLIDLLQEKRTALVARAVTKGLDSDVPMKDSGVKWLGEIPENWDVAPIYARYEVTLGKMLDTKRIRGSSPGRYLRNVDVQWDSVNTKELPTMDFSPQDRDRYGLQLGDLLVCEGGEVGRTAMWPGSDEECFYQKVIHRVRPTSKRDIPRFFFYLMCALSAKSVFITEGNPNTINHLTATQLRHYRVVFPPEHQQRVIAAYLDEETWKIDALLAKVQEAIDRLKELRTALISAAITGKIDVREAAL